MINIEDEGESKASAEDEGQDQDSIGEGEGKVMLVEATGAAGQVVVDLANSVHGLTGWIVARNGGL